VEPAAHPFYQKWVAVSSKLLVRLSGPAAARAAPGNTTSIACRLRFTGQDAAHLGLGRIVALLPPLIHFISNSLIYSVPLF
jgi:hypothetical protein